MNENLYSFYCELQRSLDRMIQVICFKHFWTNVSKLAGESMIKNLSQLRPVKFLGLVPVMVLMMMAFVDQVKLRGRSCLCQESSTSNLKLTKTLWLATCPKWISDTGQYFNLQSLLHMHQLSLAAVPI